MHATIVEPACLRLRLTRDEVAADGLLERAQDRDQLVLMLDALLSEIEHLAADR